MKREQTCQTCHSSFFTTEYRIVNGRGKYCSKVCANKAKLGKRPWLGKRHSEESKRKMSEAHRGKGAGRIDKKHTLESRLKMSLALIGRPSPRKGIKTGLSPMLGRRHTPETIKKISESKKGSIPWNKGLYGIPSLKKGIKTGKPAWNRGISPSEDTLKKLSESHKGQDHWTGRKHSAESIAKMSRVHKEKPQRYWLGKKRPDVAESSRKHILKLYESGGFPRQLNTKPEREIKRELMCRGYIEGKDFVHQFKFYDKFMCDFVFPTQKVIVECDGDYWHVNPNSKYAIKAPDAAQKRTLRIDKSKEAYIRLADEGAWILIRIWESDIKKDVKSCVDIIEKALGNKKTINQVLENTKVQKI